MATFSISPSVARTAAPPIPLAASWAQTYLSSPSSSSKELINMSQGVPGSPPDPRFIANLQRTVEDPGSAKYGGILGEEELRGALASEYRDVYGRGVEGWGEEGRGVRKEDLGVVCGANMAFMASMMALCQAGDEVILPTPLYFNASMTLTMLSVKPVGLPTEGPSFYPSVEKARGLITKKTRAIVLISPNNPTGSTYPPSLIRQFATLAREHALALVIDETYRDFLAPETSPSGEHLRGKPHDLFDTAEWRQTVVSLFSFSKSYSIPGHRLGVVVADPSFLEPLSTVLDCMQINPPRPSQIAIAPLLPDLRAGLIATSLRFTSLLDLFSQVLSTCPGWTLLSSGAFYAFVSHPFPSHSSTSVARVLAVRYGLVVLPGEFFDLPEDSERAGEAGAREKNRWLRFAVANVGEEEVRACGERLRSLKEEDLEEMEG